MRTAMKIVTSIFLFFVIGISLLGTAYLINDIGNNVNSNPYQGYDKEITRYYSSTDQKKALIVAETTNYNTIFNVKGITGGGKDVWVEYINNETLDFIDTYGQANKNNTHVVLQYNAYVYEFNSIKLLKSSDNVSILTNGVNYATKNTSTNDNYDDFYHFNLTSNTFDKDETNFTINYSNTGFIVDMKLKFENVFGNVGATYSYVRQTLVMDSSYQILHIFRHPTTHYIS